MKQHNYIKPLAVALLLGVLTLTLGFSTVTADNLKQYTSQVATIGNALPEISIS